MKKQKFCYSRFLSIILSLALLCSALVFPVSVNAATDDAAKAAAATALKTAWQKLESEHKGTAFAYPNRTMADWNWAGNTHLQTTAIADKDYYGDYYSYVDSTDSAFAGKVARVWYGAAVQGAEITGIDISTGIRYGQLRAKSGFYIYVKVEGTTEGASIKIDPEYNWQKTTANDKTVTITQDGIYKIEDTDLYKNGLEDIAVAVEAASGDDNAYDRRMQRFILKFTDLNGAKVTCGSLHWANSDTTTTVPENIETISALDLITAASQVENNDKYISQKWADFQTALVNAKAAYADVLTASDLKAAFKDMLPDGKSTGYTDARIDEMTNDELLVAATSLHTNYGVYDAEKLAAFKTALEAFKAANYTPEAAARITLNAAYGVLQTSVAQYSSLSTTQWWGAKQAGVTISTTTANTPERENLGTRYAELGSGNTFTAGRLIGMQQDAGGKPAISTYNGFYFYIQVTNTLTEDFKFGAVTTYTTSPSACENICVLPKDTEPGYYLFTDKDFYSQGYSVAKSTHNADVVTVLLPFDYSGGNIRIGAAFGYKCAATVPGDSNAWSLEKFANKTVNYIADNNYIISDTFRKLFADAQKLGAAVYNGDFANGADGFTLPTDGTATVSDGNLTYNNPGWKTDQIKTKIVIAPNTDYVLTYRFKGSKYDKWYYSGPKLSGNNENIVLPEVVKYFASNVNFSNDDSSGNNQNWVNNNTWINGFRINTAEKWTNVAIRFNSGDNDYLNMSMAFQGDCTYTYDYFKLTKAVDVEKGNVNGDSKVDILDLVVLKKFLNNGDTNITFEAAKVNTGTTVNNDDFNALRSKLLATTF